MQAETHKARMTVDALHILEMVAKETDLPYAIRFGMSGIHGMLQKAAKRAAELNDPELNYVMLYLHLYDVEDVNGAIEEMERLMRQPHSKQEAAR